MNAKEYNHAYYLRTIDMQQAIQRMRYATDPLFRLRVHAYDLSPETRALRRARQMVWRREVKREVLTHYGNGKAECTKCGFSDIRALTIDHINGGGKRHTYSIGTPGGPSFYRWLKVQNFPVGYQTLCFNCQWVKRDENHEFAQRLLKKQAA